MFLFFHQPHLAQQVGGVMALGDARVEFVVEQQFAILLLDFNAVVAVKEKVTND